MLDILFITAATLICMVLVILIGMGTKCMSLTAELCSYCDIFCYIGICLIPNREGVVIFRIRILLNNCGSHCTLTADYGFCLNCFTVNDKCYCISIERALILIEHFSESSSCVLYSLLFAFNKVFCKRIICKSIIYSFLCFFCYICSEELVKILNSSFIISVICSFNVNCLCMCVIVSTNKCVVALCPGTVSLLCRAGKLIICSCLVVFMTECSNCICHIAVAAS